MSEVNEANRLKGRIKNGRSRCGRTIQRDRVCRCWIRVPQVGQKRVRERNEKALRGDRTFDERKRKVVRKNRREKEKWYEKTVEKKNRVALLRQEVEDANKDFRDTNEALRKLRLAREDLDDHEDIEPKLGDYYEPSDEMKTYMNVVTGVVGSVSGFLVTKLLF